MRQLLISLGGIIVATVLVLQGVFTLRTGKRYSFMVEWLPGRKVGSGPPQSKPATTPGGWVNGIIFVSAGAIVGWISVSAMAAASVPVASSMAHWFLDNFAGLFVTLVCLALGLGLIARPRDFVEWIGSFSGPPLWYPSDPAWVPLTRLLGLAFIPASVFFLLVWMWIRNS